MSSTNNSRASVKSDNSHIIAIVVGVVVTFVIVLAVLIYLLFVFFKTRKSIMRNLSVSLRNRRDETGEQAQDVQILSLNSGPMWTADAIQNPYQETNSHGHIPYAQGCERMIDAYANPVEGKEPIYENRPTSSERYIGQSIYDRPSNISEVFSGSDYDYPPRVQPGYSHFHADASEYDYPKRQPTQTSEYDSPHQAQVAGPESEYDYPKNKQASESPYDVPPNNAAVGAELYDYPRQQTRNPTISSQNRPGSAAGEQPIYENFHKPTAEALYDRPPMAHRQVSIKKSVKRNVTKFSSPFAR